MPVSPLTHGQCLDLRIEALGGLGDGVARYVGQSVFVPFTCPGDEVRVRIETLGRDGARATLENLLQPSAQRQVPPCIHFGVCGGCDVQQLAELSYLTYKEGLLHAILQRLGASEALRPLVAVPPLSRRRAVFSVAVARGEARLGFTTRRSHDVFDLTMCPVTRPAIVGIVTAFRETLERLKKPGLIASLAVAELDDGLDLRLTMKARPATADASLLRAFGERSEIVRFSLGVDGDEDIVSGRGDAIATLGAVPVELPVGAFLQATREGEAAILTCVLRGVEGAERVADIYAGCGTYSLNLAKDGHRVSAYEGDATMAAALANAARRAGFEPHVTVQVRDLYRSPLGPEELRGFDAVVINPPRNGAGPQITRLAESGVRRIVVVSCNPATFERDAKRLLAEGYRLREATPIDQFRWSHHLELVAVFEK